MYCNTAMYDLLCSVLSKNCPNSDSDGDTWSDNIRIYRRLLFHVAYHSNCCVRSYLRAGRLNTGYVTVVRCTFTHPYDVAAED